MVGPSSRGGTQPGQINPLHVQLEAIPVGRPLLERHVPRCAHVSPGDSRARLPNLDSAIVHRREELEIVEAKRSLPDHPARHANGARHVTGGRHGRSS